MANHIIENMAYSSAEAAFEGRKDDALRRQFWRKLQGVAASIPFAEELLTAYYCAFDRKTPTSVKATLAIAAAIKLVTDHIRPEHRDAAQRVLADLK